MPGYIVDKTPLIAIKYNLLRKARVGDTVLGFLGLGVKNAYTSLIPGGAIVSWLPDVKENPSTGQMIRKFNVLLIDPITDEICKQVAAFQLGERIYKKGAVVPYDGVSTPAEWVFNVSYVGDTGAIIL
jgi:hypothetical protein